MLYDFVTVGDERFTLEQCGGAFICAESNTRRLWWDMGNKDDATTEAFTRQFPHIDVPATLRRKVGEFASRCKELMPY